MSTDELKRVHLRIIGKVQGVGFRYSARMIANHIGVNGWVRNLEDGTVEAIAEGTPAKVDDFVRWCHLGPQYSQVSEVRIQEETPTGEFTEFISEH